MIQEEVHRFGALLFLECYNFSDLQSKINMVEYGYSVQNCKEVSYGMV